MNDKCDICALKVIFDQDALSKECHIENFFDTLRHLQKNKIIDKGYNRRIFASIGTDDSGDRSEMCAVNSPFFSQENKDKKCPEFILNMDLSVPDALSLNLSKKNVKLTSDMKRLTWAIIGLTIALFFIGIIQLRQQSIIPELKPNKVTEHTQAYDRNSQERQVQKSSVPVQSVPKKETPQKRTNEIHK
jgi:hypothetical protein